MLCYVFFIWSWLINLIYKKLINIDWKLDDLQTVLNDRKRKHKIITLAWVDYKKAYGMLPHSSTIECLKLVHVAENIIKFI